MENKPKVTVLCTTYNHERFVRRALDGFVMQKTDFPFEVIVHDDASVDGTPDIIREYQSKYPDIIKPILQKENQFSQGKDILMDCMYDYIRGEYVAINEGDDYWTDEFKLQKQVDFLESHPEYSICFHPVRVEWDEGMEEHQNQKIAQEGEDVDIYPSPSRRFYKTTLELSDLLKYNFIQTNSVLYRWMLTREMWPRKRVLPCDHLWHLMHAMHGKIGFLPDVMAVYHRHPGGHMDRCIKIRGMVSAMRCTFYSVLQGYREFVL